MDLFEWKRIIVDEEVFFTDIMCVGKYCLIRESLWDTEKQEVISF